MSTPQNGSYVMRLKQRVSDSYWRDIFEKHDLDKDGLISYSELKCIIDSGKNMVSENTARQIMEIADRNNSGNLDLDEFKTMMQNPDFTHLFEHIVTKYVDYIVPPRDMGKPAGFEPVSPEDREIDLLQATGLSKSKQGPPPPGWVLENGTIYRDHLYEDRYKCLFWPPALCMVLLSAIQIGSFFYDFSRYEDYKFFDGPIAKVLMYKRNKREQVWRFFTYMFVHSGIMHLIENVLVQIFLGTPLGIRQRWWRVVVIYFAGVCAGCLAASVFEPKKNLAGSSAGNYALFMAHIAIIIMNWSKMRRPYIQLIVFLVLGGVNLGSIVYMYDVDDTVSYSAHIGGACAGLLVGIFMLRNLKQRKFEKRLWWGALILYICLMLTGVLIHIFWRTHFEQAP